MIRDRLRSHRATTQRGTGTLPDWLVKDMLSRPRSKSLEHVIAFIADLASRGRLDAAEDIGREFIAVARREYERTHPSQYLTLAEAHIAEQHAQSGVEEAEVECMHRFCRATADAYLAASATHQVARERLDDVVRRLREDGR